MLVVETQNLNESFATNSLPSSGLHQPFSITPTLSRKFGDFKLSSPQVKRKPSKDDYHDSDNSAKLRKNENFAKHLHEELLLLYKTKKNKDQMPSLIQETFQYRRSLIEKFQIL